jgi:poly(3-hydroxyalkanoate) synthetase
VLIDDVEPCLQKLGILPVDIIQSLFATLQPLRVLEKFTRFAGMNQLSMEARKFVLVEDWLNDGVPLTANVARECMQGWYGDNVTARGQWKIGDQTIDPQKLTMPSYVIVPGKDKIVPPESALPLAKLLPHATLHEPMSGHIGLLAGRNAAQQIWAPLIHWLKEHV